VVVRDYPYGQGRNTSTVALLNHGKRKNVDTSFLSCYDLFLKYSLNAGAYFA
jgi:hypothetical protein